MTDNMKTDPIQNVIAVLGEAAAPVGREAFRLLREGRPAEPASIAERTRLTEQQVATTLDRLVERGGARLDDRGRVVAVGGLSLEPTRHRLTLSGVPFHTWCAIDAVGIPAATGEDAVAQTTCPHCGTSIEIVIERGRPQMDQRFVAWLPHREFSSVADDMCPEMNLFCGRRHLDAWRAATGHPAGEALSVEEVARLGREWWANEGDEGPGRACECCG